MTKKKTPQTIEECNAELERTQKKLRQYENRSKMLDRRLAIEKRKPPSVKEGVLTPPSKPSVLPPPLLGEAWDFG